MMSWISVDVTDIGDTYGNYMELNPLRARLAFLNSGLACPSFGTACELAFGQGLSAYLHTSVL